MNARDPSANAVGWILLWCDFYTRGVSDDAAETRKEELASDLHDQVEWAAARGIPSASVARSLVARALRGVIADLSWRLDQRSRSQLSALEFRPFAIGLLAATVASGFVALFIAALAIIRQVQQAGDANVLVGRDQLLIIVAATALLCAKVLLARPRTRSLGAIWMLAASEVVVFVGLPVFASTARLLSLTSLSPEWSSALVLAGIAAALFYLVAALWWAGAWSGVRLSTRAES